MILETMIFLMSLKIVKNKKKESEVAQLCPTLCDPMGYSLPGSSGHGVFQARVQSALPFPSPGDLPDPGIERGPPALWADALPSEPPGKPQSIFSFPRKCCYSDSTKSTGAIKQI